MDREGLRKQYNPYTKERWEEIKKRWDLYKNTFGLEGDLSLQLKKQNLSEGEITRRLDEHRKSRQDLMDNYQKEIRKNG